MSLPGQLQSQKDEQPTSPSTRTTLTNLFYVGLITRPPIPPLHSPSAGAGDGLPVSSHTPHFFANTLSTLDTPTITSTPATTASATSGTTAAAS